MRHLTPLLAVVLFLFAANSANAQSTKLIDSINAAALVAHAADGMSTARCIGAGTCAEVNPIIRPYVNKPPAFFAIKMGSAYASYLLKRHTQHAHPKITLAFALAETATFFVIAHHNHRISHP